MAARKGYDWSIGDGSGPGRPVKEYDKTSLPTVPLPHCRYAGIALLEEKTVLTVC